MVYKNTSHTAFPHSLNGFLVFMRDFWGSNTQIWNQLYLYILFHSALCISEWIIASNIGESFFQCFSISDFGRKTSHRLFILKLIMKCWILKCSTHFRKKHTMIVCFIANYIIIGNMCNVSRKCFCSLILESTIKWLCSVTLMCFVPPYHLSIIYIPYFISL